MELSRSDFQILNVLKEHQCTNYQESMTLQEIIPELPFSRVTAYKRLKNLCDMGYTAKGCQAEQADTYYILEKGIRVADIKDITELEKKQQPVLPATDENIASALYTINKSAKVSRDTKNRSYYNRKFQCCGAAKTRMLNLYHLKDAVLKKLQEEDRVEYLGVNRQVFDYGPDSFLRLYRIGDFTFHIPCQKDEVNELEILDEEIDGEISAEKTRNVDINFKQAMLLLENYSGVKAAGTYNKKPEFY